MVIIIYIGLVPDASLDPLVRGRPVSDPALVPAALWVVIEIKAKRCRPDRNWKLLLSGIDSLIIS